MGPSPSRDDWCSLREELLWVYGNLTRGIIGPAQTVAVGSSAKGITMTAAEDYKIISYKPPNYLLNYSK
jgi:hypothetical protein